MAAGRHTLNTIENVITRLETCLGRCKALHSELDESNLEEIQIEGQNELERALDYMNKWPENGIRALRLGLVQSLDIGERVSAPKKRTRAPKKKP